MSYDHEAEVEAFFRQKQEEDPEKYREVCDKYPTQTHARQRVVRRREVTVGLLGLSPSRISLSNAIKYGMESEIMSEGD
jgi:hypothetical protein